MAIGNDNGWQKKSVSENLARQRAIMTDKDAKVASKLAEALKGRGAADAATGAGKPRAPKVSENPSQAGRGNKPTSTPSKEIGAP